MPVLYDPIRAGFSVTPGLSDSAVAALPAIQSASSGYELTGGFTDRTTGTAGASDVGSNVNYTTEMVASKQWRRFGFDSDSQVANDVAYWTEPTPAPTAGKGLFGGSYLPDDLTNLFDYSFNDSSFSDAQVGGDSDAVRYTAATGSYDFSECKPGDLVKVRFDFNVRVQVANTTLEAGLIWQTRLADGTPTFTFVLTDTATFFGQATVGTTVLQRPEISAYLASYEDVNARVLPAIRANNIVQIQPLTTLATVIR